jgi:hypothetical protein
MLQEVEIYKKIKCREMEIVLNDTKTIREIQNEFNKEFKYLKIEFFDIPHTPEAPKLKSKMYNSDRKLGLCRKVHTDGILELRADKTVAELESELWVKFGLSAQIFRKTGSLWIETNLTDAWTLERQNSEGRELRFNHEEAPEHADPNKKGIWR